MKQILFCLSLLLAAPALAQEPLVPRDPAPLSAEQTADALTRIERYLKDMTTVKARFVQISSSDGMIEGDLYLARPGRMRLDYDAPSPVTVIADGRDLVFVDREMRDASAIGIDETPARYLLSKGLSLSDPDLDVALAPGFGTLELTLKEKEDAGSGSLTLIFSDTPLQLRQWRLVDSQNTEVTVTLYNAEFDGYVDPSLFRADDFKH